MLPRIEARDMSHRGLLLLPAIKLTFRLIKRFRVLGRERIRASSHNGLVHHPAEHSWRLEVRKFYFLWSTEIG